MLTVPELIVSATESGGSSSLTTTLTTGLSSIASDMEATVVAITPIILGVVGMVMVVSFAIRFFRNNSRVSR